MNLLPSSKALNPNMGGMQDQVKIEVRIHWLGLTAIDSFATKIRMQTEFSCPWAPVSDKLYRRYHDEEWGVPEYDDRGLFEKLILDGFQAGLSWRTILAKRDAFQNAFDGFDPEKMAEYGQPEIDRLLENSAIVRSQSKIRAAIGNARRYLEIMEDGNGSFSKYLWNFVGEEPIIREIRVYGEHEVQSPESEALSKDLKGKGFKFCGPVIIYAFMQAVGMINAHELECPRWQEVQTLTH